MCSSSFEAILTRLSDRLGAIHDEPVPLEGGITNRNFRVRFDGRDCVLRLPGKDTALLGIDRGSERRAAMAAAELGIGPEVIHADEECMVTAFLGARAPTNEELHRDPGPFARALRAFHDSGLTLPNRFWVPELLERYLGLIGAGAPPAYARAQDLVGRIAAVLPLSDPVPCHNDLLAGNLLTRQGRPVLVDWEYAGMGHRLFDLGNLAAGNGIDESAEQRLVEAYYGAPAPCSRRAGLKLMRIVSDAREAAWGLVQARVSDLRFDFAGYAEQHFERLERQAADPRLEEWLLAAAA